MLDLIYDLLVFGALLLVSNFLCTLVEKKWNIQYKKMRLPRIGVVLLFLGLFVSLLVINGVQRFYGLEFLIHTILLVGGGTLIFSLVHFFFLREARIYIKLMLLGVFYILVTTTVLIAV